MKLGYKGQLALLIAGQAAALAAIVMLAYRPSLKEIDAIEKDISLMSAKQAELCNTLAQRPDPDGDIARARAEIAELEHRIPPESRVSWLSARIADTMQAHHVDLRSATQWDDGGRHPDVPELKRLRKHMSVRCTARDLRAFLGAVNRLPFVVVVEDLAVSRDPDWGTVAADVRLATFVLRADKEILHTATFGSNPLD